MRSDEQAIRDLIANWRRATATGDLSQILSLMAEDAVFLTAGNPPIRGRDAFAAAFEALMPKATIETESDFQEVSVSGDLGYAWTHLAVTVTPGNGGSPKRRSGYILTVFRKQPDGSWVLSRDANLLGPPHEI